METGLMSSDKKGGIIAAAIFEFLGTMLQSTAYIFGGQVADVRQGLYFVGWLLAAGISGAHFNPASTFAIFLMEPNKGQNAKYLIFIWIIQFCGAFAGILLTFLIMKPDESFL
jgi:hypothetical protein